MRNRLHALRSIQERNKLVEENQGLAYAFARKLAQARPDVAARLGPDDLRQTALLGLLRACELWDPHRGTLGTYATAWMKCFVLKADRQADLIHIPYGFGGEQRRALRARLRATSLDPTGEGGKPAEPGVEGADPGDAEALAALGEALARLPSRVGLCGGGTWRAGRWRTSPASWASAASASDNCGPKGRMNCAATWEAAFVGRCRGRSDAASSRPSPRGSGTVAKRGKPGLANAYILCSVRTARLLLYLGPEQTTYLLARCRTPADAGAVVERFRGDSRLSAFTSGELSRRSRMYWLTSTKAGVALGWSALLGLLGGAAITGQTLYGATAASLREYAVLRALGIPR